MNDQQKETILTLLKDAKVKKNFVNRYWFQYKDFLDPTDDFTAFVCEQFEGKQSYNNLIENMLEKDINAKIFVEVYGLEENGNFQCVYADTLIVFSKLSLDCIKQIFSEPKDLFPSDIGEMTDFSQPTFLIGNSGELIPITESLINDCFVYYCWWD